MNILNDIVQKTPLVFFIQSFWRDEAFSYTMAKQSFVNILKFTATDFNPPFYYFILKIWMFFFGSSEIALRSFSLVCYAFAVFVVSLVLEKVVRFPLRRIIGYTLLFLFNPFFMYFGFEARMYSMLLLLSLVSLYTLYLKKYRLWFVVSLVGLYTHYYFIIFLIAEALYVRLSKLRRKDRDLFIRLFIMLGLCFAPWFFYAFPRFLTNVHVFWFERTTLVDFFYLPLILLTGYDSYQKYFNSLLFLCSFLSWALFIASLTQSRFRKLKYYKILLILSIPFVLLIFFVSLIKPVMTPRYIIGFAGVFSLFIIIGISFYNRFLRYILLAILLIVFMFYGSLQIKFRRKGNIRETVRIIEVLMNQGDVMCVDERYANGYLLVSYYAKKYKPHVCFDKNFQIPKYEGAVLYQEVKRLNKPPRFPNKAYIIYSDEQYEIRTIW